MNLQGFNRLLIQVGELNLTERLWQTLDLLHPDHPILILCRLKPFSNLAGLKFSLCPFFV